MNIKIKTVIMCLLLSFYQLAQAQNASESFVKFKIKNAGLMVDGYFSNKSADIVYNANEPSKSKFNGEVKTTSINTGISLRDNHLRKSDYFDVAQFPSMTFKSTVITPLTSQKLKVIGDLTIKGITKKILIEINVTQTERSTIFSSSFGINRRDFKVGGSSWTLSDELQVFIQVTQ